MRGDPYEDEDILRTAVKSGARVLLIGRQALIALGAPVVTHDVDFWIHIDDIEKLNAAFDDLDHMPNKSPDEARRTGRYVIENGKHIDVMVARSRSGDDGTALDFDGAWARRRQLDIGDGATICIPSIDDLITTKRWASRAKDIVDIQFLEAMRRRGY